MQSFKQVRGVSVMGIFGGIAAIIFGLFWIAVAARMEAPPLFLVFGAIFIVFALAGFLYNYTNANGRSQVQEYDIMDQQEVDPIMNYINRDDFTPEERHEQEMGFIYCPYCGFGLDDDYVYCPQCGRRFKK